MRETQVAFETGAASDVGRVRAVNEDAFLSRPERGLWVVADGMGGHAGGRFASSVVVEALARTPPGRDLADLVQNVAASIGEANRRILAQAQDQGAVIGATVAILLAQEREFACVWAGDSRIYLIRDGRIQQATRDHTEAQELIQQGVLTPEQAKTWPRRHVITRAIGVDDDPELELARGPLASGDVFVLCSDGLTGHVADEEILAAAIAHSPQTAAQALVDMTLARGAQDNVTVVIARRARRSATIALRERAAAEPRSDDDAPDGARPEPPRGA